MFTIANYVYSEHSFNHIKKVTTKLNEQLELYNYPSDCVSLSATQPAVIMNNQINQVVQLTHKKTIGECGCKSALLIYKSYAIEQSNNSLPTYSYLQSGIINSDESIKTITLTSEPALVKNKKIFLTLSCAPPD